MLRWRVSKLIFEFTLWPFTLARAENKLFLVWRSEEPDGCQLPYKLMGYMKGAGLPSFVLRRALRESKSADCVKQAMHYAGQTKHLYWLLYSPTSINHWWLGGNRETFHLQASRELFFHDRDSLNTWKWLTYVRRQKSSSQSDKPPLSLYFPLVRPLFYRFINGRPNGSPDFGYESATRRCTFFFVSSTSSWVRRSGCTAIQIKFNNYCVTRAQWFFFFYLPATLIKVQNCSWFGFNCLFSTRNSFPFWGIMTAINYGTHDYYKMKILPYHLQLYMVHMNPSHDQPWNIMLGL